MTALILHAAHLLSTIALVSGSLAAIAFVLANLVGRGWPPRAVRDRWTTSVLARRPRVNGAVAANRPAPQISPTARRAQSTVRPREDQAPTVRTTVPVFASRAAGEADELADLYGVGRLAARARASRWLWGARRLAVLQISSLDDGDTLSPRAVERYLECDLLLGDEVLTAALLTTSGVFAVVVHDRDPNDAGSLLSLGPRLERHTRAVSELRRLTGAEPEILVYSPHGDADEQTMYLGRPVLTVAGPTALEALLRKRRGRGLTADAVARLRDTRGPDTFASHVAMSSQIMGARRTAAAQIERLAGPERVVEFDLELGGQVVPLTLVTTSGLFLVVVRDRVADLSTPDALARRVSAYVRPQLDLSHLSGFEPEIIVYSAEDNEPAQPDHFGGPVVRVGGAAALGALIDQRPRVGPTREALARFREAEKPHGRTSCDVIASAAGHDTDGPSSR